MNKVKTIKTAMPQYIKINFGGNILEVDIDANKRYYREHSLCNCNEDRNFYEASKKYFPELTKLLSQIGVLIERPDEISSSAVENMIDYQFVAYTVMGKMENKDKYELELLDNGTQLKIVIDNWYVPNEQKTEDYFTLTVYNIKLPWALNEPFPEEKSIKKVFSQIKRMLHV